MKILSLLTFFMLAAPHGYGSGAPAASSWLENITVIDSTVGSELYAAKIPHRADFEDRELYCVMERVNDDNIKSWKQYANVQGHARVVETTLSLVGEDGKKLFPKGNPGDGSQHFNEVLKKTSRQLNEIWVAYVTTNRKIEHISSGFSVYYTPGHIDETLHLHHKSWTGSPDRAGNSFAKNIQMFVTVTSSPEALITSHMGIATSVEAIITGRMKGISVDLHSFAAKVMLQRNPKRRFMVNAPLPTMEEIMLKALPTGSVFIGTREMLEIYNTKSWTYFAKDDPREIKLVKMMREHPSFLSVDDDGEEQGRRFKEKFTIYDKDDPTRVWLGPIDDRSPTYNWMFASAFIPAGFTHYVVVDLLALANARPIERYEPVTTAK